MRDSILGFLLIFSSFTFFGQNIQGVISDSISGQPLPLANITYLQSNNGTQSNNIGFYTLRLSGNEKEILVSSLGYDSKMIKLQDYSLAIQHSLNIYLNPKTEELLEVLIPSVVKNYKKRRTFSQNKGFTSQYSNQFGIQHATFIQNQESKNGLLESVTFSFKKRKEFDYLASFNIKFYAVDKVTGKPSEELCSQNIVINPENKTAKVTVDVKDFKVQFPKNGLFVVLETVNTDDTIIPRTTGAYLAPYFNTVTSEKNPDTYSFLTYRGKPWASRTLNINLEVEVVGKF
ncbi:MAG: carboxypeptidase-like regulatory domain-containing protein [Flavobacterium sp.]